MNSSLIKNLKYTVCTNLGAGFLLLAGANPAMAESIYPMISLSISSIRRTAIRWCKTWLRTIMIKVQWRDLL
jgi:hypothetical protein